MITDMTTALVLLVLIVGLVTLLERNHRRTFGLPRAPFGADATRSFSEVGDRDRDRLLHERAATRDHNSPTDSVQAGHHRRHHGIPAVAGRHRAA
jgi:hypothetical protein